MTVSVDVDFRVALGPVRDQGARPTCLAMAVTTAHEFVRGSTIPLSPEYLHYSAANSQTAAPMTFPAAIDTLADPGQPGETDCPYQPSDPPPSWVPPTGIHLFRRLSDEVAQGNGDEVASLLRGRQVPVIGISLPPDMYQPTAPWTISPDGSIHGFHAVAVVGLGNLSGTRCFLIRNSWGCSWGMDGHAWLTDAFLARHLRHLMVLGPAPSS